MTLQSIWRPETTLVRWLPVVLAVAGSGCAVHKITGTEIDDTEDTRAILQVIDSYRKAVEAKDPKTLVTLVDESFKDDGGSTTPDDDLDYKTLGTKLPLRFARVDELHLDINVRKIEVPTRRSSGCRS